MKWQNRGHEFDEKAKALIKSYLEHEQQMYMFGAGYLGNELRLVAEKIGCFAGYLDNDKGKQQMGRDGIRVFSLEEYMRLGKKGWIIIAVDEKYVPEIAAQLTEQGLVIEQDYFVWHTFLKRTLPVLMAYHYGKSYVELAQISVTERCSLRCRKCAHACSYVSADAEDMALEEVCRSADVFFSKVDLIREFVLIGGEPLLYRKLPEAASFIGERYRRQMIHFCITTNGTILPKEELLQVCRQYGILFRISNYIVQLPHLKEKYERLTKLLDEHGIEYMLGDAEEKWMDYGFDSVCRDEDEIELQKVLNRCQTSCREIRGNRYYYCVMARSVSDNMGFGVGTDDFLDLEKLPEDYKKILMEFELGYSEKGYLDMCRRCNGAEAKKYPVPAAEQVVV